MKLQKGEMSTSCIRGTALWFSRALGSGMLYGLRLSAVLYGLEASATGSVPTGGYH